MSSYSHRCPILVTGASGFVGGYLVDELAYRGISRDQLVAFSTSQKSNPRVRENLFVNIDNKSSVAMAIEKIRPKTIVHLAAVAEPAQAFQNQERAWQVNVEGTRNLLSALVSVVPDCRFVFAGSAECYGDSFNQTVGPITENAALRPRSYYGSTKAICDLMLGQLKAEGFDMLRVRAFNHTGPRQVPSYVVPEFAEQIAKIEAGLQPAVIRVGNLDSERDFLDVRDVTAAYADLALAKKSTISNGAFNVCSGRGRRIGAILDELLSFSTQNVRVEIDQTLLRPSEVPKAIGSNEKIRRHFEWMPKVSFSQTLEETLAYYRQQFRPM